MSVNTSRWLATSLCSMALLCACATADPGDDEQAEAQQSPSATPTVEEAAVPGDGTWEVGADVEPGVYVAEGGEGCDWMRLSYVAGGAEDVIARGILPRPVVEIMDGDDAFKTEGCGAWTALEDYSGPEANEIPDNGIWIVGADVVPGTYEADGGELCMWQRLRAFRPELDSVLKMGADPEVTIAVGDAAFLTTDCGSWTKTG